MCGGPEITSRRAAQQPQQLIPAAPTICPALLLLLLCCSAAKELAGNYGFDPLYLAAKDDETMTW